MLKGLTLLRLIFLGGLLIAAPLYAEPCADPSPANKITGIDQCLLFREFGSETPETLIIWLHGDVSSGGPAKYHFTIAEKATAELGAEKIKSIALVRPGYPDGSGEESGVAFGHGGRRDSYTDGNISEVIGAIERFKKRYRPKHTILAGHSGGAAIAAVALGMNPALADAIVLAACACDPAAWRWTRSENPMRWADKLLPTMQVVALTGESDSNTPPAMAQRYVDQLKQRGVNAQHQILPGIDHNGAFRSPQLVAVLRELLLRTPVSD